MAKKSMWDSLVWVAFAIVILYLLLKILGIIQSPISIDLVALVSGAYFVGRYAKRIDDTFNDIKNIKKDIKELNENCPIFKEKIAKAF